MQGEIFMNRRLITALAVMLAGTSVAAFAGDVNTQASEHEKPGIDAAGDVSTPVAQAMVDDVDIGLAVAADGRIPTRSLTDDFVPGETIYLTMDVSDATPGTAVKVVWYGPGEKRIGEESQKVANGSSVLSFKKDGTQGWAPGDYRAEVWLGDEKVNDESFNIVSARTASK
jgi:hypothetical protein